MLEISLSSKSTTRITRPTSSNAECIKLVPYNSHMSKEGINSQIHLLKSLLLRNHREVEGISCWLEAAPKVNHTMRELHNFLIRKLYRDSLLNELMRETNEVLIRRKRIQEMLGVLEQAHRTLEEFPLEAERIEKGYNLAEHATGLPKIHGLSNADSCCIFSSFPNRYDPRQASHIAI